MRVMNMSVKPAFERAHQNNTIGVHMIKLVVVYKYWSGNVLKLSQTVSVKCNFLTIQQHLTVLPLKKTVRKLVLRIEKDSNNSLQISFEQICQDDINGRKILKRKKRFIDELLSFLQSSDQDFPNLNQIIDSIKGVSEQEYI